MIGFNSAHRESVSPTIKLTIRPLRCFMTHTSEVSIPLLFITAHKHLMLFKIIISLYPCLKIFIIDMDRNRIVCCLKKYVIFFLKISILNRKCAAAIDPNICNITEKKRRDKGACLTKSLNIEDGKKQGESSRRHDIKRIKLVWHFSNLTVKWYCESAYCLSQQRLGGVNF